MKPQIYCVPPDLCADVMARCEGLVERGLSVAPEMDRDELVERLADRTVLMWIVLIGMTPHAIAFTERVPERDAVMVFGLSGRQVWKWAKPFAQTITDYARKERVDRVLFAGKAGWGRIVPDSHFVEMREGQHVFERSTLQ